MSIAQHLRKNSNGSINLSQLVIPHYFVSFETSASGSIYQSCTEEINKERSFEQQEVVVLLRLVLKDDHNLNLDKPVIYCNQRI